MGGDSEVKKKGNRLGERGSVGEGGSREIQEGNTCKEVKQMLGSKVTLRKKNSRYVKSGQHIGHHFPSNTLGHFQSSSVPTFPLKQRGMKGRKGQSGKWGSKHYELSTQTMPSATAFGLSCSSASLFWPRPELCHLFSFLHGRSMYIQVVYVRTNGHICVCLFIIEVFFFFFYNLEKQRSES